jgi:ribokinase
VPKLVNLGSLCIDNVYRVTEIARPGETVSALAHARFAGGKGLNQSIAAARAGVTVRHFGCIGDDGLWLRDELVRNAVDVTGVRLVHDRPTGHATLQVNDRGENAIVIVGGANLCVNRQDVERALDALDDGDWLLLQNEINDVDAVLQVAAERDARVVLNLAPVDGRERQYPIGAVDLLVLNEIEAASLAGERTAPRSLDRICHEYPELHVVLTRGDHGLLYGRDRVRLPMPAFDIRAVDETAAGDAFIGYLMQRWLSGAPPMDALALASAAGALACTIAGAAPSLPAAADVRAFLETARLREIA